MFSFAAGVKRGGMVAKSASVLVTAATRTVIIAREGKSGGKGGGMSLCRHRRRRGCHRARKCLLSFTPATWAQGSAQQPSCFYLWPALVRKLPPFLPLSSPPAAVLAARLLPPRPTAASLAPWAESDLHVSLASAALAEGSARQALTLPAGRRLSAFSRAPARAAVPARARPSFPPRPHAFHPSPQVSARQPALVTARRRV
jgi:hypothetical protein